MCYKEWKTQRLWAALATVMKKDVSEEVVALLDFYLPIENSD